jgi:formylmethanofuran dehydrogenase subunit E
MKSFHDVVEFHGHACPGLALGYRVSCSAVKKMGEKAADEEIVAIVENNSCAVDAVQVMTGCTFGKGNLIYHDYGKQVYTFFKRESGYGIRISVIWKSPKESRSEKKVWEQYIKGDRTRKVLKAIQEQKDKKISIILNAKAKDIYKIADVKIKPPEAARIYPSLQCSMCKEKVMEPKARIKSGKIICIPCLNVSGN